MDCSGRWWSTSYLKNDLLFFHLSERKEIASAKKQLGVAAWSRLMKQFGGSQSNENIEPILSPTYGGLYTAVTTNTTTTGNCFCFLFTVKELFYLNFVNSQRNILFLWSSFYLDEILEILSFIILTDVLTILKIASFKSKILNWICIWNKSTIIISS